MPTRGGCAIAHHRGAGSDGLVLIAWGRRRPGAHPPPPAQRRVGWPLVVRAPRPAACIRSRRGGRRPGVSRPPGRCKKASPRAAPELAIPSRAALQFPAVSSARRRCPPDVCETLWISASPHGLHAVHSSAHDTRGVRSRKNCVGEVIRSVQPNPVARLSSTVRESHRIDLPPGCQPPRIQHPDGGVRDSPSPRSQYARLKRSE
jgi:hypothetical protein